MTSVETLKPVAMHSDVVEAVARAIWSDMLRTGQANDLRDWVGREWQEDDWRCFSPALDDKTKEKIRSAARAALASLAPPEGLAARDDVLEDRSVDLQLALDWALAVLIQFEPGDSRAVSNEFVAAAAIQAGFQDDKTEECRSILRNALDALKGVPQP